VSLFAELFNEMLIRDFGFCIYKALLACPDKAQEDMKRDDGRKKGSDKRSDGKKRDDKKCDKDNVEQHDKGVVEMNKVSDNDGAGDDAVRNLPEVHTSHSSLFATFVQSLNVYFSVLCIFFCICIV